MKDLTSKAGLSEQFEIASAATSAWEIGNPVYPPARQKLAEHGIDCNGKTARQMTRLDYAYEADTWMPDLDQAENWELEQTGEEQTYFDLIYYFTVYKNTGWKEF